MFNLLHLQLNHVLHLRQKNICKHFSKYHVSLTVYPKKCAHGFCFAVLCCGYTLTDFPISIRLTSLAVWQSNDCPSASKATLMNMDEYFMWIHYERLHNHNKAKHNKPVCIFLGIYCSWYYKIDQKCLQLTRFSHTLLTKMAAISGVMISTKGSYHSYAAMWLIVRFHGDSKPRDGALKWWYRCNIWHASQSSAAKSHSIPKCLSQ